MSNNLVADELMGEGLGRRQPVTRISRDCRSECIYNHKSRTRITIGGLNKNVPFGSCTIDKASR